MELMNDSVIICTPSSPDVKKITNQRINNKKYSNNKFGFGNFENVKEDPSVQKMRIPLRTVYESPLGRREGNPCNGNSPMVINLAAKRFQNNTDNDIEPPKKKFKTDNINETIILISDDESEPPVIQVNNLLKNDSQIKKTNNSLKAKSQRRSKRLQEQEINRKKAVTDNSELNDNEEDIAVIWSSTSGCDSSEHTNIEEKNCNSYNEPLFFIDTSGDKSNYKKEILYKDSLQVQTACQNQSPMKRKLKNKQNHPNVGKTKKKSKSQLREIIVDGSNVAYGYSRQQVFSKMGLKLVLDYFRSRGHSVKIFLPQHQRKKGRKYLENWYRRGNVVFTPSRNIGGKNIVPYDDRFIVEYATKCKGIIVTSDQYRDLWNEKPEWRETIEKRLIAPTFVGDYVMFPEDPLGRLGPTLDEFLRH